MTHTWHTIKELAAIERVSSRTIRRWIDLGLVACERYGKTRVRVRRRNPLEIAIATGRTWQDETGQLFALEP